MNRVAAVLLDMDGTLVDSDAAVQRAWWAWAVEHELDPAEVLAAAQGVPSGDTVRRLLPHLDAAAVAEQVARQLDRECRDLAGVLPAVGAHRLLATLERLALPWAVVTSADRRLAAARLNQTGITAPMLITVDDVTVGKPDPSCYLLAAQRLGVAPGRCLVVEDAEAGVVAGKAAGAMVAALRGWPADLAITDLGELDDLLTQELAAPARMICRSAKVKPAGTKNEVSPGFIPDVGVRPAGSLQESSTQLGE
jgi:HAD superfamily hydrolase (TIGR01509 family)